MIPYIKKGKRIGTNQMLFDASRGHEYNIEYENEEDGILDELNNVSPSEAEDNDRICFL